MIFDFGIWILDCGFVGKTDWVILDFGFWIACPVECEAYSSGADLLKGD